MKNQKTAEPVGAESCLYSAGAFLRLHIKAAPGTSKSQVLEECAGRLRVAIAGAPENGKANAVLIAFFAKLLDCPKNNVKLCAGAKSRLKTLEFPITLKEKLENLLKNLTKEADEP
jgi:uncharacterized protein (TIGR00251 family)